MHKFTKVSKNCGIGQTFLLRITILLTICEIITILLLVEYFNKKCILMNDVFCVTNSMWRMFYCKMTFFYSLQHLNINLCRVSTKVLSTPVNFDTAIIIDINIMFWRSQVAMRCAMRPLVAYPAAKCGVSFAISKTECGTRSPKTNI